jgi:hypothetical protein
MTDSPATIRLELAHATDLFETPTVELGAAFGSTIPGIDVAVGELTANRQAKGPLQLAVVLPAAEAAPDVGEKVAVSLRRYCAERRRHNENIVRAMKRSGWRALRIGFPITVLGLIIVAIGGDMSNSDPIQDVVDIIGWVLAWLGLWYPFDKVLFYPLDLVRENRALQRLETASVTVERSGP